MADITTVQDYLIVQPTTPSNPNWKLEKTISATATSLVVNFEPLDEDGASITKDFLIGIETGGYVETMLVTSVSTTTLTVVRGLALAGLDFTGVAANGVIHRTGSKVFTNIPAPLLDMTLQALRGVISSNVKFATRPTFDTAAANAVPVYADATARDAALTSPAEGDRCRVTALGAQEYDGSAWVTFGVSTPITASLGCEKVGQDIRLDIAATNDINKLTGNELDTNLTATKAQLDEAGTFFGATDITGSEAETLTSGTSSDADSLHTHDTLVNSYSSLIMTRDATAATGSVNVAHGLSVVPKSVIISWARGYDKQGSGSYDGTNQVYEWSSQTGADSGSGNIIYYEASSGNTQVATLTVDSTNLSFSWVKTGTPTGIIRAVITVFA